MAWTQTQIDALRAAIASGKRTVTYGDKSVTYQSLEEMIALLRLMESEVAASGGASGGRSTLVAFSRG